MAQNKLGKDAHNRAWARQQEKYVWGKTYFRKQNNCLAWNLAFLTEIKVCFRMGEASNSGK